MLDDETPQEMHNPLKRIINNKLRSLKSKQQNDHKVVKRMQRAFLVRNTTLCTLIRESPRKINPDEVLGKVINHEIMEEETNYVKNLSKGIIITTKPDEITLKAMKKQKVKVVEEEPSSEDEEEESSLDDKEMEFFI